MQGDLNLKPILKKCRVEGLGPGLLRFFRFPNVGHLKLPSWRARGT